MDETLDPIVTDESAQTTVAEQLRERNEWLEQSLDPTGSLPKVDIVLLDGNMKHCIDTLPADVPFIGNAGSLYIKMPDTGESIGDAVFGKDDQTPTKLVMTDASILDTAQGRGYGRRLYLEALKALPLGYGLISHSMLTPVDGEGVWQWLIDAGVAKQRDQAPSGQLGKYETVF